MDSDESIRQQLSVDVAGDRIEVRIAGLPTQALLRACQQKVLELVASTGCTHVLYDTRAMKAPKVQVTFVQREMDAALTQPLRRAIVVPDTKLAYLARLSFGEAGYRVFYDDIEAARAWLGSGQPA